MKVRLKIGIITILILLLIGSSYGCNSGKPSTDRGHERLKIGLLVEGNIFDQSWDSLAYQTLRKIERELNAEVTYSELHGQATDIRIEEEAMRMINEGYRLIFGHGAVFQNSFNRLGPNYPDVNFVFFNGTATVDNVYAINFAAESIGFISGVGAALMTNNGTVGVIAAYPNQLETVGFEAGVAYINPQVQVLTDVVGDWGDREKGKFIAEQLIDQGADVIVGFGDGFNIEVINVAREKNAYAIGFLRDQSFIARDTVIYSVTQNVEEIYMEVVTMVMNDSLEKKPFATLDFGNGGQGITTFSDKVPREVQERILHVLEQYKRGEIRM